MDYLLLTQEQKSQISLRKLLDLEAEHFGLEMDVKVALTTGVENENVVAAQQRLVLLARQIDLVRSWLMPAHEEPAEPAPNGLDPVEVE